MDASRRRALKAGGGITLLGALFAAGFLKPGEGVAAEWNKTAFGGKTLQETLKALGAESAASSKDIALTTPDIAENGAVVPVAVQSNIPNTQAIVILIEKNPNPLAASFDIPQGTEPVVGTRVKMGQTSNVYAVVKADGKFYSMVKEVKVTLGGCGG
jgi:sulfur-oxidizing protein SoxY